MTETEGAFQRSQGSGSGGSFYADVYQPNDSSVTKPQALLQPLGRDPELLRGSQTSVQEPPGGEDLGHPEPRTRAGVIPKAHIRNPSERTDAEVKTAGGHTAWTSSTTILARI